jgi:glyoxylase I family protein
MADFIAPVPNSASPFADMRGHHIALRTPDLETAKRWYVEKLDFRVIAEWDYADEQLAYIVPPTEDHFYIEILGGGDPTPQDGRPYTDLDDSLNWSGYHHFLPERDQRQRNRREAPLARRHHRDRAVRAACDQAAPRLLL